MSVVAVAKQTLVDLVPAALTVTNCNADGNSVEILGDSMVQFINSGAAQHTVSYDTKPCEIGGVVHHLTLDVPAGTTKTTPLLLPSHFASPLTFTYDAVVEAGAPLEAWNVATTYAPTDKVESDEGDNFNCVTANTGVNPDLTYWKTAIYPVPALTWAADPGTYSENDVVRYTPDGKNYKCIAVGGAVGTDVPGVATEVWEVIDYTYSVSVDYTIGNIVKVGSDYFECLVANGVSLPVVQPNIELGVGYWEAYSIPDVQVMKMTHFGF